MATKGIILAGGSGTRLHPLTLAVSKQLMPIYDKPMIYYPLSVLMLTGIRDILVITTPEDMPVFERLLRTGEQWGLRIAYAVQARPEGLPHAFIIGKDFIGKDNTCLILGDNIFFGGGLPFILKRAAAIQTGACIFGYRVDDPERYGVVVFDTDGKVRTIEEKPSKPKSNYAVPGLYFFDSDVVDIASTLKPSARGEIEIIDVIKTYLNRGDLRVELFGRGFAWMDTGTHDSYMEASMFIQSVQKRQGLKVACLEEIAFRLGYIDEDHVRHCAQPLMKTDYGQYLLRMLEVRDDPTFASMPV